MEPASTPEPEAPSGFDNPVLVNSPLTGLCRGAVASDPRTGMGLWFITDAEVNPGSYCPVKISDVDGINTVTTMGRVVSSSTVEPGTEVVMSLPLEDDKLVQALTRWFPLPEIPSRAPEALGGMGGAPLTLSSSALGAASAPGAAMPEAQGFAQEPATPPGQEPRTTPSRQPGPVAPSAPLPAGLQSQLPHEDSEELDLTDLAETLNSGQKKVVNNEIVRFQYDSLLGEADQLEAQGRFGEAYKKVEKALSIYPIYADDLHVRLAKIALGNDQLKLAQQQAETAQRLNPSRRDVDSLLRQIANQRTKKQTAYVKGERRKERRKELANTLGAVALFLLVVAPTAAYNIWTYLIPHGPQPEVLSMESFADLVSADKAMLQNGVVYFFVSNGWLELSKAEKNAKMKELVARTKRLMKAQRVVVTDPEPRLLATANNDRIKVYR